jgi:hypothetical protein
MNKAIKAMAVVVVVLMSAVVVFAGGDTAPKGWILSGSNPADYSVAVDSATSHNGHNVLKYMSVKETTGFGTVMQMIKADKYKGKRVRLSGYIKSGDVKSWAGLWMRVDSSDKGDSIAFDNMQNRAVKGTTAWKKYEVVLDVSATEAKVIAFGFLLDGPGTLWVSEMSLDIVDKKVPLTDMDKKGKSGYPDAPVNLEFK